MLSRDARRFAGLRTVVALTLALPLWALPSAVWADTTLIADLTLSGLPEQAQDRVPTARTVTYYIKGERTRTESVVPEDTKAVDSKGLRRVTIYDRSADAVYLIDDTAKTYSVLKLSDVLNQQMELPEQARGRASLKVSLSLEERKGAESITVAEQNAQPYTLEGSLKIEPKLSGLLRGGGGRRRRGGGGGGAAGGGGGRQLPEAHLEGEVDGVAASTLLSNAGSGQELKEALLPFVREMFPGGVTFRQLLDRLADRKIVPVKSRISIARGGGSSAGAATPVVSEMQVRSVSDAALEDSLFAVPEGYRKVDPPAPRAGGAMALFFNRPGNRNGSGELQTGED